MVTGDVKAVASNAEVFDGEAKPDSGDTSVPGETTTEPGDEPVDPETNYYWYQVREARELKADDQIVIVAANDNYAMSATHSDNGQYRPQVEITKQDNRITSVEDVQIITLEAGTVEGTFAFNVGEKYLTSTTTTGSDNHLKETIELDDNASWNININKGIASIVAQGEGTKKTIRYNSSNPRFSCYAPLNNQEDVSIYKYGVYTPCTHNFGDNLPSCEYCGENNPNYVVGSYEKTISEAIEIANSLDSEATTPDLYTVSGTVVVESASKVYLTDETNRIQVYSADGNYENLYQDYLVTVQGNIKNYHGNTPEIVNFTVESYTPAKYTVTIPIFENGSITASATSDIDWGTTVTLTVTPNANYEVKKVLINDIEVEINDNTCEVIVEKNIIVSAEFVESGTLPQTESATLTFDDTAKRTEFSTSKQVWEENGIIVTNNKGSGSNIADYADPARFYKNSELIVEKEEMLEISFNCNSSSYATALNEAIKSNFTTTVNSKEVKVEFTSATNLFTATLSSGQVQMDSITVTFVKNNSTDSDEPSSGTDTPDEHNHIFVEGKCECGETDPTYETQNNVTKELILSTANRTIFNNNQQVFVENGIILTNDKSSSTSDIADYGSPARFYASSTITVEAPGNITKIVFDCNTSSYATALKNSIGTLATTSSDKVTITLDGSSSSFVITKLTAQVRMDSLTVTYLA